MKLLRFVQILRPFAVSFPGFVAAAGILNLSFVWLLNENSTLQILTLTALPGILTAWFLFGTKDALFKFVLPSLCALAVITGIQWKENHSFETLIDRENTGCEIVVKLWDSSLCGGKPEWLRNAPYHTQAEITKIRFSPDDEWIPTSGSVFLRFPRVMPGLTPGYGDSLKLSGILRKIEKPLLPEQFDFAAYSRIRGIHFIFETQTAAPLRTSHIPLLRRLYDGRGMLLDRLGEGMSDSGAKELAAALLFGMKQGIDPETRDHFLRSGTIHVLSVSGLHIGLFFGALLLIFRFLPYRARWLLVLIPVWVYACSTGMQAPAFRAFVMLAVWCILRAFLWKTNALNTIAIAAVILMLLNPAISLDAGFQYSFACVLYLIYSSDFVSRLRFALHSRWKYSSEKIPKIYGYWVHFLSMTIVISLTAWLASFGISMFYQGLFSPYSVPAFLFMSPVAWLCFAIFVFSVLFCWLPIPGFLPFCGWIMEFLLRTLKQISVFFGDSGYCYTRHYFWWETILFLILLLLLLTVRTRRIFAGVAILLVCMMFFTFILPDFREDELLIACGREGRPMLILSSPRVSRAVIVNIPDYDSARIAADYLRIRGNPVVEEIFFDSMRKESCGGAYYFLRTTPVRALIFPERPKGNTFFALSASRIAQENKIILTDRSAFFRQKTEGSLIHLFPEAVWRGLRISIRKEESGGFLLELQGNGKLIRTRLPLSAEKQIQKITLSQDFFLPIHR